MSYIENVLNASGGYGAPEEVLIQDEKKEPVSGYFSKPVKLIQPSLKSMIADMGEDYSEEYVEISDLTPTQEDVDSSNFKDAAEFSKPIIVYKDSSGMYLVDGHHRCASKVLAGGKGIKAKVYKGSTIVAALEKDPDDPCWSGYVQLGMKKGKNGKMVPNCVPAKAAQSLSKIQNLIDPDEIVEVLSSYNTAVGPSRAVPLSAAAAVAARSYDAYSGSCSGIELKNAVLWETHSFMEFATLATTEDKDIMSEHLDLLPAGHPELGLTASLESRVNWIAGAPEIEETSRDAIRVLLSEIPNPVEHLHASTRVRALLSSGAISQQTAELIQGTIQEQSSY